MREDGGKGLHCSFVLIFVPKRSGVGAEGFIHVTSTRKHRCFGLFFLATLCLVTPPKVSAGAAMSLLSDCGRELCTCE